MISRLTSFVDNYERNITEIFDFLLCVPREELTDVPLNIDECVWSNESSPLLQKHDCHLHQESTNTEGRNGCSAICLRRPNVTSGSKKKGSRDYPGETYCASR